MKMHGIVCCLLLIVTTCPVEPMYRRCVFGKGPNARIAARRKCITPQYRFFTNDNNAGVKGDTGSDVPLKRHHSTVLQDMDTDNQNNVTGMISDEELVFFKSLIPTEMDMLDDTLISSIIPLAHKMAFDDVLVKKDLAGLKLLVEKPLIMRHVRRDQLLQACLFCLEVMYDISNSTPQQTKIALQIMKLLEEALVKTEE